MNFSLAFLAALALTGAYGVNAAPVSRTSELHQVLEEFLALVPHDEIVKTFFEYLDKDEQVQRAVQYISSDGFKQLVQKVEATKDAKDFYAYLDAAGLDIYGLLNKLHVLMEIPHLVPGGFLRNAQMTGGVAGLIADIKTVLPIVKIKALYEQKLKISAAFAELVKHFESRRFWELWNRLRSNNEYEEMVKSAKENGVKVQAIMDLLATIFGLDFMILPDFIKGSEIICVGLFCDLE